MFALGIGLGALLGLILSLVAWWVTARVVVPRIQWSREICRTPGDALEYRIKFGNVGRRDVVDVAVTCTLRVRNLDRLPATSARSRNYATVGIPLRGGQVDVMRRKGRRDLPPHLSVDRSDGPIGRNRLAKLLTSDISDFQTGRLPEHLQDAIRNRQMVELEQLLGLGDDAYLDFTFFCYDGYSGARRVLRSAKYRKENIAVGNYARQGFEVVRPKSSPAVADLGDR